MDYNHAEAEIEWRKEIARKRKRLKEAGVPDEWIEKVIEMDREEFKKDRSFYEHEKFRKEEFFLNYPVYIHNRIETFEDIFQSIADPELLAYLKKVDTIMLTIILLKTNDYEIKEIADELNMSKNAIYKRIHVFRKNLPKQG